MIIGTILEVSQSPNGPDNNRANGSGCVVFYNEADCVEWCIAMSEAFGPFPSANTLYVTTVMYNTNTNTRRYWFDGTEYTG